MSDRATPVPSSVSNPDERDETDGHVLSSRPDRERFETLRQRVALLRPRLELLLELGIELGDLSLQSIDAFLGAPHVLRLLHRAPHAANGCRCPSQRPRPESAAP